MVLVRARKGSRPLHPHRHDLLLAEGEGAGREEQGEAHPPKMSGEALGSFDAALQDHLEVHGRGQGGYAHAAR